MAAAVCLGLHSSFTDPLQKVEGLAPLPASLRLRLSLPESADPAGWGFLQRSLSSNNCPQESSAAVGEKDAYALSPVRQPPPKLSHRSLQLCTENLGSETGTEVIDGDGILSHVRISEFPGRSPTTSFPRQPSSGRKANRPREIPPPLTTLRGAGTFLVRAHREKGRLVINAVRSAPRRPSFRAERIDGRLRLSLNGAAGPRNSILDSECEHQLTDQGLRDGTGEEEHSSVSMESFLLRGEDDPRDQDGEVTKESLGAGGQLPG